MLYFGIFSFLVGSTSFYSGVKRRLEYRPTLTHELAVLDEARTQYKDEPTSANRLYTDRCEMASIYGRQKGRGRTRAGLTLLLAGMILIYLYLR
jgi:hypothetical protein